MTDAEDLLLEIANSMSKDFPDPVAQLDWILDEAKKYFIKRGGALSQHNHAEPKP